MDDERGAAMPAARGRAPCRPPPLPGGAALARRFARHLRHSRLIEPGQTLLVGVSGGADSVVLLHLLRFGLPGWGLRLVAAHFDHAMRPGSAADADWVAGLARAWGVDLVRDRAGRPLRGEADAREARYRFLCEAAERCGAALILTGHHADDQAETVLFRMIRGTGLAGLGGIPPRRDRIVRPLLPFRRRELLEYAEAVGLRHREDPTNRALRFARNRLRHEVIPRLEAIAPGASAALARLADQARAAEAAWQAVLDRLDEEALVRIAEDRVELARPLLLSYHPAIRARMLRRWLRRLGSLPDRAGTRAAAEFITKGASGAQIHLPGGVRLERDFDRIRIRRVPPREPAAGDRPLVIEAPGTGSGTAVVGGRSISVRWRMDGDAEEEAADAASEVFDAGALRFPLEVRGWRAGDRIRMPYGTKKLKKLFTERRVGRLERARVPVLAELGGRTLWIVGVARAAVAEPASQRPRFIITVTDAEPVRG